MPGRNGQVTRFLTVLRLLEESPRGLTIKELTDMLQNRGFNETERTIRRDILGIEQSGFPLSERKDEATNSIRFVLEPHTKVTDHFLLTSRELIALFLARGVLVPLKDTPFYQDLESIFKKIDMTFGKNAKDYLTEMSQEFHFEPGPRWGLGIDPDTLTTVRSACTERQALSVVYSSANSQDKRQRKLGPHYLYFAKGSLYLVAEDFGDNKVKVFSVARMTDALMLDEEYQGEVMDPEQYFKSSFGVYRGKAPVHVRLQFAPEIAPYVKERRWHETQSVVSKGNGSITLTVDVALTPEFIQWVLGFGSKVEVLEPAELQTAIYEEASKLLERYKLKKVA